MDIWIVGEFMQDGWAFIGAYATEEEMAAVLADSESWFGFQWEIGRPMDEYEWPGELEGFRWCDKVIEKRRIQQERRATEALMPMPPVEHEVIRNDDGSTTVRAKE